ncbi:MAG: PA2779 family protein [Syntrophorhabdales bacterium]
MKKVFMRILLYYLVVAMFVIGIAPQVNAGFSPSQSTVGGGIDRDLDLRQVRSFLEMKVVADRFEQLGFSAREIESRLSQLNDEQLHRIALNVDQLKVGGDGGAAVIIILVIVVLVLIIFRLLRLI